MWFYKKNWSLFLLYFILLITVSCGFKPLYGDFSFKRKIEGNLEISEVSGKEGYHLKEALLRRFGEPRKDSYLLNLTIKTSKVNEVISPNNEITSYRLIMTANYNIKNSRGEIVLPTQKSVERTGFSSASNSTGYATQIAEEAAKKKIGHKN